MELIGRPQIFILGINAKKGASLLRWHNKPFIEKIKKRIKMFFFLKKKKKKSKKTLPTSRNNTKQVQINNVKTKRRLRSPRNNSAPFSSAHN